MTSFLQDYLRSVATWQVLTLGISSLGFFPQPHFTHPFLYHLEFSKLGLSQVCLIVIPPTGILDSACSLSGAKEEGRGIQEGSQPSSWGQGKHSTFNIVPVSKYVLT